MKRIPLTDSVLQFWGASDIVVKPTGASPRRLPAWTAAQIPDVFTNSMVGMASGVRLAFRTDSPVIDISVSCSAHRMHNEAKPTIGFDLAIDGEIVAGACDEHALIFVLGPGANDVAIEAGASSKLSFDGLPPTDKLVEIWLPARANVIVESLSIHDDATASIATHGGTKWVHYGSSISHCLEAERPSDVWPAVAARKTGANLTNLGLAGCCHLDQFVARTIRDMAPDVITLKLGINIVNALSMSERAFIPAVHGFLDTIREGLPTTPILVISPIYCPPAENDVGPTGRDANGKCITTIAPAELRPMALTLRRIREILSSIVDSRAASGDENLSYLNGLELFDEADIGDMPDDLHPNANGYVTMGDRFATIAKARGLL